MQNIIVEAHRGASGYKHQNTIEAFDEAVRLNSNAIELDVRKTKDNKLIVVHDPTFNNIYIRDWNYEELVNATKASDKKFEMPLLIDVINRYKGKILLDVEIKEYGYEHEIVDMLKQNLTYSQFQIRSFIERSCKKVKEYDSNIYTILLIGNAVVKYGIFSRLKEIFPKRKIKRSMCDAVSPHYLLTILWFVKRMHMQNKKVFVWTVNSEKVMNKVIKRKVDGIVSDYPDKVLEIINSKSPR